MEIDRWGEDRDCHPAACANRQVAISLTIDGDLSRLDGFSHPLLNAYGLLPGGKRPALDAETCSYYKDGDSGDPG